MTAAQTLSPAEGASKARPSAIEGFIDAYEGRRVYGWAWDRTQPGTRLRIELTVDDAPAAQAVAASPRPDLKANGIGDGNCAFEIALDQDGVPAASLGVVAVNPSTGARHTLAWRPSDAPPPPELAKVEPLLDLLHASQRRAVAAMQAAERKFDEAATRLTRVPDMAQTLDQIRATQGDLARRIAEAEVFLVRFDTVLNGLEQASKQKAPEASFNRQSMLVIGLGILAMLSTVAAVVLAFVKG